MAWKVLLILALGVCDIAMFGRIVWGPGGVIEYRELKRQYASLKENISRLDEENMALSRDIRLLQSDNQYVEKMVRQKLRYLRDNEIVYLFPGKNDLQNGAAENDGKN